MFNLPFTFSILQVLLLAVHVCADCECGYTVNNTLYTDLLETDFLHLPNITLDTDWLPQNYTVIAGLARGPYGKNASISNVISNPLKSQYDWSGVGELGGDPGLQLYVRGGIPADGLVPMAEMATQRDDILYGSFRAAMKVTGAPGTCGAFFWYFNDTQEIDMEFLSNQANLTHHPVNLVLQSPLSEEDGYNAVNTPTFSLHPLPFIPDSAYHEYRFDWSPSSVSFYADGVFLISMNTSVPTSPGHITLSHWSNGDQQWSGGPPQEDAILTVEYFKGYFNSSSETRQNDWAQRCKQASAPNATCVVPEVTAAPDGNVSAKTWFFSQQNNMTVNQTTFGANNHTGGKKSGASSGLDNGLWCSIMVNTLFVMRWVYLFV